jgi:hypothetical protein
MKKIEINKLNKEIANKIQKKIISLKNDKKIKLNKIIKNEGKILSKTPLINKYKLSLNNKIKYNRINKINLTERTKVTPNIKKINKIFEESK